MRILREGETGRALAPGRGRVPIVYQYRNLTLDSGLTVPNVLVGVDEETDEVLTVPAQSAPRIKQARVATKDEVLETRLPRELEDVLVVLGDHFQVRTAKFSPALIRFYLWEAVRYPLLARRLVKLSRLPLAQGPRTGRIKVRCEPRLTDHVQRLSAELGQASLSDLVRGAILAAKQDVLDGRSRGRAKRLEAVATAI